MKNVLTSRNGQLFGFIAALSIFGLLVSFQNGSIIVSTNVKHVLNPLFKTETTFMQHFTSISAHLAKSNPISELNELQRLINEAISSQGLWAFAKSELSIEPTANCSDIQRLGKDAGGADQEPYSICFDAPYAPRKSGECLVYSFGIAYEWDFDDQIASKHLCKVLAFDPSMNLEDNTTRDSGITFFKLGLSERNFIYMPDGTEVYANKNPGNWTMRTLRSIANQFNHGNEDSIIDVLKVDVEGAEVESLHQAISDGFLQKHVMQLTLEWHLWYKLENDTQTLEQLIKTHRELVTDAGFELFHLATRTVMNGFFPLECYVNKHLARTISDVVQSA